MPSHWMTKRFFLPLILSLLPLVGCHRAPQTIGDILSPDVWPIAVADKAKFEGDTLVLTGLRTLSVDIPAFKKQTLASDYRGKIILGIQGEMRAWQEMVGLNMVLATPTLGHDGKGHVVLGGVDMLSGGVPSWRIDPSVSELVEVAPNGQASRF